MVSTVKLQLPPLYPIADAGLLRARGIALQAFARELKAVGVRFLQYRDKQGTDAEVLEGARLLRGVFPRGEAVLILNDRAHLCSAAEFDGVHVGQGDLEPDEARVLAGGEGVVIGLSTHTAEQVRAGERSGADYLAIGPVYETASKANPDAVVGVEGVQAARALTGKPLVAIGGITRANCRAVFDAGAGSVAVIGELLPGAGESTAEVIRDFLSVFR